MEHGQVFSSLAFFSAIAAMPLLFPSSTHAVIYSQQLNFNFLCSVLETNAYVRDMPWDCASYVICMDGQAIPTTCPQGKMYASASRNSKCVPANQVNSLRCHRRIWDYITTICHANPTARVPNPEGCSHFFDCRALGGGRELMNFVVECPYPTLFSKETGECLDYRLVYCGERKEPKTPCEYLQYMQMYDCRGPNCIMCNERHPSCVGRLNGPQYVPQRTDVMMECNNERTVKIMRAAAVVSQPSSPSPSSLSSLQPAPPSASSAVVTSSNSEVATPTAAGASSSSSSSTSSSSLDSPQPPPPPPSSSIPLTSSAPTLTI